MARIGMERAPTPLELMYLQMYVGEKVEDVKILGDDLISNKILFHTLR